MWQEASVGAVLGRLCALTITVPIHYKTEHTGCPMHENIVNVHIEESGQFFP